MLSTDEDAPVSRNIEASDPDGGGLRLTAEAPAHGTVAVDGLRITYTPAANYHGPDTFLVTVSNGELDASAKVDVTVRPVNDAPVAAADAFAATEDTPLVQTQAALLANDTDVDGDVLTVTAVSSPINGAVTMVGANVTFTPAANFSGTASFQYTVTDGTVTAAATVMIDVGGANDAPVAADDTAAAQEDTPLAIAGTALVANDTDPEAQTLTVTAVANAANGTVALAGGTVTFTPAADYSGPASFDYTVSDGAASDTGHVTIDVAPVDDAPVANDDTSTTPEDTALQLTSSALTANDTDVDGPSLAVTAVFGAVNGTVVLAGGIATFTPAASYSGPASFQYTVSDGTSTDTGAVAIDVTPVDDAPVATDDTATTAEDTALLISAATLLANDTDVDGPSLSISAVGDAINGAVTLAAGTVTFTPAANFSGTASFSYTLTDGTSIDTGVVTVDVTPVDDAPVAADDTASGQADTALVISHATLLANDTDIDGPALAITAVQDPVNGTVVLGATTITFTPSPGFSGAASFDYVVGDGTLTDLGTVAVTVIAGPVCGDGAIASPETCDDGGTAGGDGCSATCQSESGWTCAGAPSTCTPICGDGMVVGGEPCDDGNPEDTDGCTTQCVVGAPCTAAALPGADRFAVDPATGHCYASFDGESTTFAAAQAACAASGGYLATITSAAEQAFVNAAQNPAENPWIGAGEDGNDTDAVFDWVTDEAFGFSSFAPGQPDDDAAFGGNGECLHLLDASGQWNDTNCNISTFVVGRICEVEPAPCGDSILQPAVGEECDDGNTAGGDGCSATCQLEDGCGDGNLDPGEECDDNNTAGGDGCSATCQAEDGCGDGNLDPGEECDDDNTAGGDGCSATCQLEDGCGDGNLDPGEECDDDNFAGGDGCSATCQLEDGCGDGNLDTGEQCDDDNTTGGDGCSATCQNERLSIFTFTGAAGTELTFAADDPLAAGLASKPVISRGPGLTPSAAANAFSSTAFTTTAAIDLTDYYTFTVTPTAGFTASVRSIELDERRSGTGILSWAVRSSLDGFTADVASFTVPNDTNTRHQIITLGSAFGSLAAPVEFRIYGFAAAASTGTWRLDNVAIFGFTALQ